MENGSRRLGNLESAIRRAIVSWEELRRELPSSAAGFLAAEQGQELISRPA
jgi:hypothetical protein